jgi:hypothetical protein
MIIRRLSFTRSYGRTTWVLKPRLHYIFLPWLPGQNVPSILIKEMQNEPGDNK